MSRLEEILNLVQHVPPFPKVAQRVMELIENPAVTARQLAEVIQYDQAITANVLKICNASYFGLPRKVSSLGEALVLIGHDTLKDILVTSSSARFYGGNVAAGYHLEQGELWKHSVATAIMAKLLVRHVKGVDAGSAFTAGLLHDIGKRFLSSFVADDFKNIMQAVTQENIPFEEAEKRYLGATHAEVGALILKRWEFPVEMIMAVRQHHNPDALQQDPLTALIALSNALVVSMGIGTGADGLATRLQGGGIKRFGITQADLDLHMAALVGEMDRAQELLHLN
ncbi:MAG: HDOD domain-containing protein [Desulfobulbaceae bacterium]|nr:HDOD domain-containing protein [Desulfobulbaceae bacterium]